MGLVRGRVVHAALERMLVAHREHSGPSWGDPALLSFWKRHFPRGIPGVVREEAERERSRATGRRDRSLEARRRREVGEALPSLAVSVEALLRMTLSRAGLGERGAAFAEVPVEAEMARGLRWRGRIDAVVRRGDDVTLIDFKTGAASPSDMEQLTAYACLFERDPRTRALGTVKSLAVLYTRGGVVEHEAPTGDALVAERERFAGETEETVRRLALAPPEAAPAVERCARCDVRGRCDAYWSARSSWEGASPAGRRAVDVELIVKEVLGGTAVLATGDGVSWFVRVGARHAEIVSSLRPGAHFRVVGADRTHRPDFEEELDADVFIELGNGGAIIPSR